MEYHGIPFAAPPTGSLRWALPQAPMPWNRTLQATEKSSCPQLDLIKGVMLGKESCLHLSVYTPAACTAGTPCAVMQWIYGGAWILGSNYEFGEYDGAELAHKFGVVVVAGNYRLDSLGWLALEELKGPDGSYGNYGLHDQRAALQWTQRNVARFGGDPNRVTIFGESAGGFSVCQHMVSPASNGLFSSAIMESGDCDGPWMIFPSEPAKAFGDAFATALGCSAGADRVSCLRELKLKDALMPLAKEWLCPSSALEARANPPNPWCNTTSLPEVPLPSVVAARNDVIRRSAALDAELASRQNSSRWPIVRPPSATSGTRTLASNRCHTYALCCLLVWSGPWGLVVSSF